MPDLQGISGFFHAGFLPGSTSFLFCFEGFWLVNINPGHQPVKLPPGKIPDLRLLPGPLIATADRQPLIDQNEAIRFAEQGFNPVPSSSTEKEESTGRRIHLKLVNIRMITYLRSFGISALTSYPCYLAVYA